MAEVFQTNRTVSEPDVTESFQLSAERLERVFTKDADQAVRDLFYKLFAKPAWEATKMSERFTLYADLTSRAETVEAASAKSLKGEVLLKENK